MRRYTVPYRFVRVELALRFHKSIYASRTSRKRIRKTRAFGDFQCYGKHGGDISEEKKAHPFLYLTQ